MDIHNIVQAHFTEKNNMQEIMQRAFERLQDEFIESFEREVVRLDEEFRQNNLYKKQFHSRGKKTRYIETLYGTIRIERYSYSDKETGEWYYYVDDKLGLEKHNRIFTDIIEKIYTLYGEMSVRKIAETMSISRQHVYNILAKIGVKQIKYDIESDDTIETVFIQADEDHIKLQKKRKKSNSEELKMITVHTGKKKICKGRNELQNKQYFLFVSQQKDDVMSEWERVYEYISKKYPKCKKMYLGADGGTWINKSNDVNKDVIRIYDKFHLEKNLKSIFGGTIEGKRFAKVARDYIKSNRKKDFKIVVESWFSEFLYNHVKRNKTVAYDTILNNWSSIRNNWLEVDYAGTNAESHVSHYSARLFSSRPKGFSSKRLACYAKVQEYLLNKISFKEYNQLEKSAQFNNFNVKDEKDYTLLDDISFSKSTFAVLNHSTNTQLKKAFRRISGF